MPKIEIRQTADVMFPWDVVEAGKVVDSFATWIEATCYAADLHFWWLKKAA